MNYRIEVQEDDGTWHHVVTLSMPPGYMSTARDKAKELQDRTGKPHRVAGQ